MAKKRKLSKERQLLLDIFKEIDYDLYKGLTEPEDEDCEEEVDLTLRSLEELVLEAFEKWKKNAG